MRRFVIVTSGASDAERGALTKQLARIGVGWSHYLRDAWLVVDRDDAFTVSELSVLVDEVTDGRYLVLPVGENVRGWIGRGPERMFDWLRRAWTPPE